MFCCSSCGCCCCCCSWCCLSKIDLFFWLQRGFRFRDEVRETEHTLIYICLFHSLYTWVLLSFSSSLCPSLYLSINIPLYVSISLARSIYLRKNLRQNMRVRATKFLCLKHKPASTKTSSILKDSSASLVRTWKFLPTRGQLVGCSTKSFAMHPELKEFESEKLCSIYQTNFVS